MPIYTKATKHARNLLAFPADHGVPSLIEPIYGQTLPQTPPPLLTPPHCKFVCAEWRLPYRASACLWSMFLLPLKLMIHVFGLLLQSPRPTAALLWHHTPWPAAWPDPKNLFFLGPGKRNKHILSTVLPGGPATETMSDRTQSRKCHILALCKHTQYSRCNMLCNILQPTTIRYILTSHLLHECMNLACCLKHPQALNLWPAALFFPSRLPPTWFNKPQWSYYTSSSSFLLLPVMLPPLSPPLHFLSWKKFLLDF